jgi:hypothetical protein
VLLCVFDEPVDWLTGKTRKRMRQITCFAAADGKLWFRTMVFLFG